MTIVVNEANFQQEIIRSDRPVLLYFWTPWCKLCHLIEPIMANLDNGSIKLATINADKSLRIANHYSIRNVPTVMLFHHGKPVQKMDSFSDRDRLQAALKELIHQTSSLV